MLSKECFKNNFVGCCAAKGIKVDEMAQRFVYDAIKNQFSDDEFTAITRDVFLNENFYGKMPDISLWTSRKKKEGALKAESDFLKARQDFQDKVMEICYSDYVPQRRKDEFRRSLTASENRAMSALGDIGDLWSSCRTNGEYDGSKADFVIRRLQKEFERQYDPEADGRLMITEERNEEMAQKIENLLEGMFK